MDEYESFVEPVKISFRQKAPVRPKDMELPADVFTTMWFDTGQITGWAVLSIWRQAIELPNYSILKNVVAWSAGEFLGSEAEITDQMMDLVDAWEGNVDAIGCEDFILRTFSMGRELLSPVRINARFEDRMHMRSMSDLLVPFQLSAIAEKTVPDDRMKLWGFWTPLSGQKDARWALRHALTYAKRLRQTNLKTAKR